VVDLQMAGLRKKRSADAHPQAGAVESGHRENLDVPEHIREAYRLHFEDTTDVIYCYDAEFRIQYVSPSVQRVLGYSPDEIMGKTFPELGVLAPESLPGAVTDAMKVLDGHRVETEEYVFITRDGERRTGEVSGTKLIEDGKVRSIISVARDITERKRAETARLASDANYQVLFKQSPIAVMTFDTELRVIDVNDQFLVMMDTKREKVIGFPLREVEDRKVLPSFEAALLGESRHFEGPYHATTSSRELWVYANSSPIRDEHGVVVGGIAAIDDITVQKDAETAMRKSEELHKTLFQQSPLGIYTYDKDWIVTECNERLVEMLGSSRERLMGLDMHELKDTRLRGAIVESMSGRTAKYEGEYVPTTGNMAVQASFIMSPLLDDGGQVVGGLATVEDISARLEAEDKLRTSEEIHRALFSQPLLGIFTFDGELRVTDCNDTILKKIDGTREAVIGFDLRDLADRSFVPAVMKAMDGQVGTYEGPYTTTNGKHPTMIVSLIATPLWDADGNVIGGIAAMEDISEQAKARRELKRYSERLEEIVAERTRQLEQTVSDLTALNEELEAFGYSVSHDLRVPLRAIAGLSRMVMEDPEVDLGGSGTRHMDLIVESTDRMGGLIDDLLGLSRAGRKEMRSEPVDMAALAGEVIDELRVSTRDRAISFSVAPMPEALGDRALLKQAMMNLLENAVKFTRGRPAAMIEVAGQPGGTENTYHVKDNGVGFDMGYSDKLFGVFQRLHRAEDFEGTGVGLALTQRIVHRHGGRVWAEGEVDMGATFFFTLPALPRE
jgi:PAS domain S-box-containing protein